MHTANLSRAKGLLGPTHVKTPLSQTRFSANFNARTGARRTTRLGACFMKIHDLVTTTEALAQLCARWAQSPFIAVDTEFMRENPYWPDLCLIQVADEQDAAAIDPKADGLDLKPLLDLLTDNEDVLKVVHAGGQDIEIICNLTGKTPHPMFDTQIAAMALGQGEQVGYSNLVDSWLGIQLDKGARFTDWARRPLDQRQIDYAIGDVTHLAAIFPQMLEKLRKTGRGVWLNDEMERIADPSNYVTDPQTAWKRVKVSSRKPEVLGRLKALAVTSSQRSGAVSDVPTVEEAGGAAMKGYEASSWFGLLEPAGTSPDTVNRIQQEVVKALNSPAVKEKLLAQGAIPGGNTPAEFAKFIDAEHKKWAQVVKVSGAKVA